MSEAREGLLPHLRTTLDMTWHQPPEPIPDILRRVDALAFRDTGGHERYLREYRFPAGDAAKNAAYIRALKTMRGFADDGRDLNWPLMVELQALVLDRAVGFRDGPAFAQGGRTVYAYFEGIAAMFQRKVEVDQGDGCHPLIKAVRGYLDIVFFHPFPDGNARCAMLWYEFLLRRAGVPVPDYVELARLRKIPGDERRAWSFVTLSAKLLLRDVKANPGGPRARA